MEAASKRVRALLELLDSSLRSAVLDLDAQLLFRALSDGRHKDFSAFRLSDVAALTTTLVRQTAAEAVRTAVLEAGLVVRERKAEEQLAQRLEAEEAGRGDGGAGDGADGSEGRQVAKREALERLTKMLSVEAEGLARANAAVEESQRKRRALLDGQRRLEERLRQEPLTQERISAAQWADEVQPPVALPKGQRTTRKRK